LINQLLIIIIIVIYLSHVHEQNKAKW